MLVAASCSQLEEQHPYQHQHIMTHPWPKVKEAVSWGETGSCIKTFQIAIVDAVNGRTLKGIYFWSIRCQRDLKIKRVERELDSRHDLSICKMQYLLLGDDDRQDLKMLGLAYENLKETSLHWNNK